MVDAAIFVWANGFQNNMPTPEYHRRWVEDLIPMIDATKPDGVLEVGAGAKPTVLGAALRAYGYVGFDIRDADVTGDVHFLPFRDSAFDMVVARHVLEHCVFPYLAIREMARVARRHVFVVVPNMSRQSLENTAHLHPMPGRCWKTILGRCGLKVKYDAVVNCTTHLDDGPVYEYRFLTDKT